MKRATMSRIPKFKNTVISQFKLGHSLHRNAICIRNLRDRIFISKTYNIFLFLIILILAKA